MWTKEDLVQQLCVLGIKSGDTLLVHSSIKAVGEVEGGADTIIDALEEAVTENGLLVLPTHSWSYIGATNPIFSVQNSPSCVGMLPEIFRHRPDVVRSLHPTHSVAAWGKEAEIYCEGNELCDTPCAWNSPWGRLAQRHGKILMLGSPIAANTFIHGIEEWNHIPNRLTKYTEPLEVIDRHGKKIPVPSHRHKGNVSEHYGKVERAMLATGLMKTGKIGDAFSRLIDAEGLRQMISGFLTLDPDLFSDDREVPKEWYSPKPEPVLLENSEMKIVIDPVGAELSSVMKKDTGWQYLWQGDPALWRRKSPILFPFVGISRNGRYTYQGKTYDMPCHGYASSRRFTVLKQSENCVTFRHSSDEKSRKIYPFDYELRVTYSLSGSVLSTEFQVENQTDGDMYFSIGGHPGFRIPMSTGETWSDYELRFEQKENADIWCFRNGGMQWQTEPYFKDSDVIRLIPHMFDEDALIFKGLRSRTVKLGCQKNNHSVTMDFHRFPTIAFWSAGTEGPFICIEPWCGHADMIDHDGELTHKAEVQHLLKGETFSVGYTLTFD